jgi:hypothetical protein
MRVHRTARPPASGEWKHSFQDKFRPKYNLGRRGGEGNLFNEQARALTAPEQSAEAMDELHCAISYDLVRRRLIAPKMARLASSLKVPGSGIATSSKLAWVPFCT